MVPSRVSPSNSPGSYVRLKSSQGDYIGQGKSYEYLANQFTGQGIRHGIEIAFGGFRATFAAPQGANLAVGEYAGAKRHP